ncbi:hypothetical protein ASswx1_78 [Aeromonas phage Asswx_1]|uniref:Uncharacterized protein n=1 Tax=Aeromonas phage Asswx_1 TaxID=2419739 RepID=A0A411B7X8_9CAUD|nr:hypothetical protein ASswx1_78 [Aeromonas phage Asswx_1]
MLNKKFKIIEEVSPIMKSEFPLMEVGNYFTVKETLKSGYTEGITVIEMDDGTIYNIQDSSMSWCFYTIGMIPWRLVEIK